MPSARQALATSIAYSMKIGIVVGIRHALAAETTCGARDGLGTRLVYQGVRLARLRDVPILAELAGKVAAGCAERQHRRAGEKVVERLLLDGVDAEAAQPLSPRHAGAVVRHS